MLNPRIVLTRAQILDNVWDYDFGGDARVLETYVSYLRKKVDVLGPPLIHMIETLTTAISLLGGTNALACNYLGVAYQHAGEVALAERAYQRALALNPDLSEVRFNLGCLWLAQKRTRGGQGRFHGFHLAPAERGPGLP